MTIDVRPFDSLGQVRIDWLTARHHFSFGSYRDPARMGIGALRVWNDDRIQPGTGFDPHPHRDMEIITYVRRGAITHRDTLGNEGRTDAGTVQVMSAGTGVMHAEYNLEQDIAEIFQIWILPDSTGHQPRWESRRFPQADRTGALVPLASGRRSVTGALPIHQDATLWGATLPAGRRVTHRLEPGRAAYLVPATGTVTLNGVALATRDGAAISDVETITIDATADAEILIADVPW